MQAKSRPERRKRGFSISSIFIILGSFLGIDQVEKIYPAIQDNLLLNFIIFVSIYSGLSLVVWVFRKAKQHISY
ncbi:unnamed protein product [Fructobacillus tropaeoli]|nr:unnamed protein product [Fructobacillus tropaeoli]